MKMKKNNLKKYCFALDLIDEKDKIDSYIEYHKKVWPEIYNSIRNSGVKKLEIFQIQNRLFMICIKRFILNISYFFFHF